MNRLACATYLTCAWFGSIAQLSGQSESPQRSDQYQSDGISVPGAYANEPHGQLSMERASIYLDHGALAWSRERKCVSCHTNGTYLFIRPALTESLGEPNLEIRRFFVDQLAELERIGAESLRSSGTRPAQAIYIAAGLAAWDAHVTGELSPATDKALRLMLELQLADGNWSSLDCWPPLESSAYQAATMAAIALAEAPGWMDGLDDRELNSKIERLQLYLQQTDPPHDYAQVLILWASLRMRELLSDDRRDEFVKMIFDRQQTDGGWSIRRFATPEEWGSGNRSGKLRAETDFESPASDGHMTGLALIVLQESGIGPTDPRVARGLQWLRTNQRASGRWWTRSLNTDGAHYITFSGTAYPLLALQYADE